jgi:hypothetical protein
VANELIRSAHFRRDLRRVAAKDQAGAAQVPLRMRSRRAVRHGPLRWLAVAASLCAMAGAWLLLAQRSTAADHPILAGATLAAGQVVAAGEAPLVLSWRDGTQADLSAGASLRVEDGAGKRLALLEGTLTARVAKQPADAPLRIGGIDCEAVVLGTVLEFSQAAAAARLAVSRGSVRLVRSRDGFETIVTDGGTCLLPFHGLPGIDRQGISTVVLDDDGMAVERSARCGGVDSCQLGSEPGISGATALRVTGTLGAPPVREVGVGPSSWILLTSAPRQGLWDLGSSAGLEFWYRGPGTGGRVWIEVICQQQPGPPDGDAGIQFVAYASDSSPGWRLIRLPWSAFALRGGQPPGAQLHTARIRMFNIAQLGEQHPDFAVDRIASWRDQGVSGPGGPLP